MKNVIYFTVENDRKILVGSATGTDVTTLTMVSEAEKKAFQKVLGHPLKNLYINFEGKEYKLAQP